MFPLLVSTTLVYLFPIPMRDAAQMDFPYVVCAASREEEKKRKTKSDNIKVLPVGGSGRWSCSRHCLQPHSNKKYSDWIWEILH